MINNEIPEDKTNFGNTIFLRCAIVGILGFLKDKFKWINQFDSGPVEVNIPFYHSLTGDQRFITDAFYDDIPGTRVNSNTDVIPRGILSLKNWADKPDEFTNPNIWLNHNIDSGDELKQIVTQVKAVPIRLGFTIDVILQSEIDLMKTWQTFMDNMWIYRYFTFDYNRLPINAVFNFKADTENSIIRDVKFGDTSAIKLSYNLDIHTFYPIFDNQNKFDANRGVRWILEIWQNSNLPAIPITGGL